VIIAILTPDRLLLPIAPWILVVSAWSDASLNEDEPTMALAPAPPAAADGEVAALAAELAALLAGVLAGAAALLLLDGEEHAASTSAPAVTARPAAIFLFIRDLLVSLPGREVLINVVIRRYGVLARIA
jgi:hypothetical protein